MCFINFSNHPSEFWSMEQKEAALVWGEIIDIKFPEVSPDADTDQIIETAHKAADIITDKLPEAVMCQGEFTLVYHLVRLLKQNGIKVVSACSERCVKESVTPDGSTRKEAYFRFKRFREY